MPSSPPPDADSVAALLDSTYATRNLGVPVDPTPALELLHDPEVTTRLVEALRQTPMTAGRTAPTHRRERLLKLLSRAAIATASRPALMSLCEHAGRELRDDLIDVALVILHQDRYEDFRRLVGPLDPEPLLGYVKRDGWLRIAAIRALHWIPEEDAWPVLSAIVANETGQPAGSAVGAAAHFHGPRSDGFLRDLLDHPDAGVADRALSALVGRQGAAVADLVRGETGSQKDPYWTGLTLARHGDEQDVPFIAHRLGLTLKRKIPVIPWEGRELVPFLDRHRAHPVAERALTHLRAKIDRVDESDRAWLGLTIAGFEEFAPPAPDLPAAVHAVLDAHNRDGCTVVELREHLRAAGVDAEIRHFKRGERERFPHLWSGRVLSLGSGLWIGPTGPGRLAPMAAVEFRARYFAAIEADAVIITDPLLRCPGSPPR